MKKKIVVLVLLVGLLATSCSKKDKEVKPDGTNTEQTEADNGNLEVNDDDQDSSLETVSEDVLNESEVYEIIRSVVEGYKDGDVPEGFPPAPEEFKYPIFQEQAGDNNPFLLIETDGTFFAEVPLLKEEKSFVYMYLTLEKQGDDYTVEMVSFEEIQRTR